MNDSLALAAVGRHFHEVQGAVEAAGEVAGVQVEGKLAVLELEHHVAVVGVHQIGAAPHVGEFFGRGLPVLGLALEQSRLTRGVLGHEAESQAVAFGGNAVRLLVGGAFHRAVLRALHGPLLSGRAVGLVPGVAREAVHAAVLEPPGIQKRGSVKECGKKRGKKKACMQWLRVLFTIRHHTPIDAELFKERMRSLLELNAYVAWRLVCKKVAGARGH